MEKILSVAEMQSVEREANEQGLSYKVMMENAGNNLAFWINREYRLCSPRTVLALVGSGKNGGDALIALCKLVDLGWRTSAIIVRSRMDTDPLIQRYLQVGGSIVNTQVQDVKATLPVLFQHASVVIDGVLGTGARLPLPEDLARILEYSRQLITQSSRKIFVVAVDCPSGANCDNGEVAKEAIPADVTYSMAGVKQGLLKFPAANLVGTIQVGRIGDLTISTIWNQVNRGVLCDDDIFPNLPTRPRDAHKGTFGTALIVGGSGNYPGATLLSGEAAYRIGAGLVTIAIPEFIFPAVAGSLKEATWVRLPHLNGWIIKDAVPIIRDAISKANVILVGPGLGLDPSTGLFVEKLIKETLPVSVIDADGLKLLARIPEWYKIISSPTILTPHPGEMMVLTGLTKEEIQENRFEVAEAFAKQWCKVVVLKGAFTIIAEPGGASVCVPVATPALARAGTGDVLAGLIAGLVAQGLDPFRAAYMGAYIHAFAGVRAEAMIGGAASVLAGDVIDMLPKVLSQE